VSIASEDLNGDGGLDLAVANVLGDSVSVLLNRWADTPVEGSFYALLAEEGVVRLRWTVEALAGIEGFNVYRATSPEGPFCRLNGELIPASSTGFFEDTGTWPETTFWYELRAVFPGGVEDVVDPGLAWVTTGGRLTVALHPACPNPFTSETTLLFDVPSHVSPVSLGVYNVRGQLVRDLVAGPMDRGRHVAWWDARDTSGIMVSSGVYFLRLSVDEAVRTSKVLLVR
jgi:hypothetical protein